MATPDATAAPPNAIHAGSRSGALVAVSPPGWPSVDAVSDEDEPSVEGATGASSSRTLPSFTVSMPPARATIERVSSRPSA
jgi:hypothetical protein